MRTLILGAGATGGYFGARMLEASADVTFLVRARRAEQLRRDGLVVKSQYGDVTIKDLSLVEKVHEPYDLIMLSCKAYDLASAMDAIGPAVGEGSMVLPLLNGMRHIEELQSRFAAQSILGGCCIISSELEDNGTIVHLNNNHSFKYGELSGSMSERLKEVESIIQPCNFASIASLNIVQDMWEKWVLIASLAAFTTLMRAAVGDVARSPFGKKIAEQLASECLSILRAYGFSPRQEFVDATYSRLVDTSSTLTASMLRDMERGNRVEGAQILGDFVARAEAKQLLVPVLETAYCHVSAYQQRRERELTPVS